MGTPGVRVACSFATASCTRAAALGWPRWSSSSAVDRIAASGSATPWPAMSGAEPCAGPGVDTLLGRDLVRETLGERAAGAHVQALGALAYDHEVDLAGVGQRRLRTQPDPRRTQVDVVVEGEPQAQQQAALQHARRYG